MTFEEVRALPLMDCVLRETLRIHPPFHCILRYVREDTAVSPELASESYVIPKGHYVMASPIISQMDPLIWNSPEKWDPSRWSDPEGVAAEAYKVYLDENGEKVDYGFGNVSKGSDSPYQPFGAGRHRCIGEQVSVVWLPLDTDAHCHLLSTRICSWERSWPYLCETLSSGLTGCLKLTIMLVKSVTLPCYTANIPFLQTMIALPKEPRMISYRRR